MAFCHRSQIPLPCLQVSGFRVIEVQSAWELSRCAKTSYMEHHRVFALSNDSSKPKPTLSHCPFCEGPCQIQADDVSGGLFHLGGSGKHLERHFEMVRKFLQTSKPRQCECPLLLFVSVVFVVSLVVFHLSPCSSHHFFSSRFVLVELGTENYETSFGETGYVEYEIDLSHEVQNFPVGTSAFWLLLLPQQNAPKPDVITQAITRPWVEIVEKVDASLKTPRWWLFAQDANIKSFWGGGFVSIESFLFPDNSSPLYFHLASVPYYPVSFLNLRISDILHPNFL